MKYSILSAILLLLLTSVSALADEPPSPLIQCHMNDGRFVADLYKGADGLFRAKITRYMHGKVSIRFEGPVSVGVGDSFDGSTMLLVTSMGDADPSSDRVPEFDLMVKDNVAGELYSNHFQFPYQAVRGSCTVSLP